MNEHSHEEVTHLVHVRVPYNLKPGELVLDESSISSLSLEDSLRWMISNVRGEDEAKRIITSAALLLNTGRNMSVGQALDTAIVWERG